MTAPECAACRGGWPAAADRIADLGLTVVSLHDDQFFPGWTVVVLKRHACELFELSAAERAVLIEEVTAVARALAAAFRPVKVNYAVLGNVLPHIHWHVIPRLAGDPAPREPVWAVDHDPVRLGSDERRARITAILAHLGR